MSASLYALPESNLTPAARVTVVSGTADPDYPAANLGILNPARPARLLEHAGAWLIDLLTAAPIDLAALIHHNFAPGATVTLEANSADAWSDPPLSEVFTVPADDADGYPRNPWLDLAALYPTAADRTYRYWRLLVAGNDAPVAVGELLLCRGKLQLECELQPGMGDEEEIPSIAHDTDGAPGAISYVIGAKWRRWTGQIDLTEEANITAVRTLYQAARGSARGFLVIPKPGLTDAWFAKLDGSKFSAPRQKPGSALVPIGFQEISRGLPL